MTPKPDDAPEFSETTSGQYPSKKGTKPDDAKPSLAERIEEFAEETEWTLGKLEYDELRAIASELREIAEALRLYGDGWRRVPHAAARGLADRLARKEAP